MRVNIFAPGFIETEATLGRADWKGGRGDQLRSLTPMGHIPGPAEIAGTALFLATDDAEPHHRRLHGGRRRLQHGRCLTRSDHHFPGERRTPMSNHPHDLPLADARALIARAVDKAEQLGLRGGLAVVGASGALVSASRLDHGGPGGMARARSKAWISATQQIPSTEHLHRMTSLPAADLGRVRRGLARGDVPGRRLACRCSRDGVVVGGVAASGATVSPFLPTGVAPSVVSADGEPANPEDLLIAYALDIPYVGQHGDDRARWQARFGDLDRRS